jgi:RNA polymerase sigma-70 factor (ECF subfamily)
MAVEMVLPSVLVRYPNFGATTSRAIAKAGERLRPGATVEIITPFHRKGANAMEQDSSFDDLMRRVRQGDNAAAEQIYTQYANRVIGLARSRLSNPIRQKEDPDDVAQSVFKSFFRAQQAGQFQLEDREGLWKILFVITLRKCARRYERYRAQSRDARKEVALEDDVAHEPAPEEAVLLTETVEELLRDLHDRERPILVLALNGHTPEEISTRIGRTERTVYRVLKRVREKLEEMRSAQDRA